MAFVSDLSLRATN